MRAIKFRVWYKPNSKMYQQLSESPCFGLFEGDRAVSIEDVFFYEKQDFEVMQYTGLTDKNGVEIYEGDILRVENFLVETIKPFVAIVEWDKTRFALNEQGRLNILNYPSVTPHGLVGPFNTLTDFDQSLEIIGNIHENPDLLEGESK